MRKDIVFLTFLGAITGLFSGTVVLAFRNLIQLSQQGFMPGGLEGNFEALPFWAILALPIGGGLLLGLVFDRLPEHLRNVGIAHVLQQLRHTGRHDLPLSNALVQFFAGIFAIVCGHSVDREGPAVHLGAASGSLMGLRSDDADSFTLTAAGAAAAIAAAFNTPLAGVVFVIEVLGVRYRIDRFIPILTASVAGALVSRAFYGDSPLFIVDHLNMGSLYELVPLAILGLVTGVVAVVFITLAERTGSLTNQWRPSLKFTLGGCLTGLIGLGFPQVMGVSYDTLSNILHDHIGAVFLVGLLLAKLIATGVSIGLRIPGGLIGPSLFMGCALGGFFGAGMQHVELFHTGSPSFYATIGMIAMMSAILRAPLAALFALLELTGNPNIIFPGMVAVVCADLLVRQILGKNSIFEQMRRLDDSHADEEPGLPANDR